jgi:hypothetical protein
MASGSVKARQARGEHSEVVSEAGAHPNRLVRHPQ